MKQNNTMEVYRCPYMRSALFLGAILGIFVFLFTLSFIVDFIVDSKSSYTITEKVCWNETETIPDNLYQISCPKFFEEPEKVDCFDNNNNQIVGEVCLKERGHTKCFGIDKNEDNIVETDLIIIETFDSWGSTLVGYSENKGKYYESNSLYKSFKKTNEFISTEVYIFPFQKVTKEVCEDREVENITQITYGIKELSNEINYAQNSSNFSFNVKLSVRGGTYIDISDKNDSYLKTYCIGQPLSNFSITVWSGVIDKTDCRTESFKITNSDEIISFTSKSSLDEEWLNENCKREYMNISFCEVDCFENGCNEDNCEIFQEKSYIDEWNCFNKYTVREE